MQRLEVSCAVRRIYTSLGAKGLMLQIFLVINARHNGTDIEAARK
jgi:hypothetical protein